MQQGGQAQPLQALGRQAQLPADHHRIAGHAFGVAGGQGVACVDHGREGGDGAVEELLQLVVQQGIADELGHVAGDGGDQAQVFFGKGGRAFERLNDDGASSSSS